MIMNNNQLITSLLILSTNKFTYLYLCGHFINNETIQELF